MRGMIKWKPFNTLLNNKDINEIIKTRNLAQKPIIMEDRIIEINNDLNEALKMGVAKRQYLSMENHTKIKQILLYYIHFPVI